MSGRTEQSRMNWHQKSGGPWIALLITSDRKGYFSAIMVHCRKRLSRVSAKPGQKIRKCSIDSSGDDRLQLGKGQLEPSFVQCFVRDRSL